MTTLAYSCFIVSLLQHLFDLQMELLKAAMEANRPDIVKFLLAMEARIDHSILMDVIVTSENE